MNKIFLSAEAQNDLKEIRQYITEELNNPMRKNRYTKVQRFFYAQNKRRSAEGLTQKQLEELSGVRQPGFCAPGKRPALPATKEIFSLYPLSFRSIRCIMM